MIVDYVHDVVCPWCRIGLANLRAAAAQRPDDPIEIRFRPFQLNPGMPDAGVAFKTYMSHVAGSDDIAPVFERVVKAGEAAGVTFHFDKIEKSPNTILAHMLIAAAPDGDRGRLIDALHKAYFEDGRDIGDQETLLAIATETGLDARAMDAALNFPDWKKMVSELSQQIRSDGVTGVPFFVFNDAVALSGAHPPVHLVQAMEKAAEVAAEKAADAKLAAETANTSSVAAEAETGAATTPAAGSGDAVPVETAHGSAE